MKNFQENGIITKARSALTQVRGPTFSRGDQPRPVVLGQVRRPGLPLGPRVDDHRTGGGVPIANELRGRWVHPQVAIDLAPW
jgi:hypothetical protein